MTRKLILSALIAAFFLPLHLFAQHIITTIAGNGTYSSTPYTGPALSGSCNSPHGIIKDDHGDIFFSGGDGTIKKIDSATGTMSNIAGTLLTIGTYSGNGGPATAASLGSAIYRVTKDKHGNLYFAENNTVAKIDTNGIYTILAGDGTGGGSTAEYVPFITSHVFAKGIIVDSADNIYIGTINCVRKVDAATGLVHTIAGNMTTEGYAGDGGPATNALIDNIEDMCFDRDGNILILEHNNSMVRKIDLTTGIITKVAGAVGAPHLYNLSGIDSAAVDAHLGYPLAMCCDTTGNIFITGFDDHGHYVLEIDQAGILRHIAGRLDTFDFYGDGGNALAAMLWYPLGICYDPADGGFLISDKGNQRIRKLTPGIPVGIDDVANNSDLTIFPNPSSSRLHVSANVPLTTHATLCIVDVKGQLVYNHTLTEKNADIDVSNLANGTYFLSINTGRQHYYKQFSVIK